MRRSWLVLLAILMLLGAFSLSLAQTTDEPPDTDAPDQEVGAPVEPGDEEGQEPALPAEDVEEAGEGEEEPAMEAPGDEEISAGDELAGEEVAAEETELEEPGLGTPGGGLVLPRPNQVEVFDVPNDGGAGLGVLWYWDGATSAQTRIYIEVKSSPELLDEYRLTDDEWNRLSRELDALEADLRDILPVRNAARAETVELDIALRKAIADESPEAARLRREYWQKQIVENERMQTRRDKLWDRLQRRTGRSSAGDDRLPLLEKYQAFRYLEAAFAQGEWISTNIANVNPEMIETKADYPDLFGLDPEEADKLYAAVNSLRAVNPAAIGEELFVNAEARYDYQAPNTVSIPLTPGVHYDLRMVVMEGELIQTHDLGGAATRTNYLDRSKLNNLIFAAVFAALILSAIAIARRNPKMFIRRISGLEAVDEAIGRATEMGKPVLYLCGLDPLSTLPTIAAVNILGRVARRIADYDSDLLVPCRDPVVLTVAQEVVKEGYIDAGRPDAYREDNIFFVTDDQFSYTAATCGIMMREKPAANFFMGYYYAESLLLAETGASTGAIQIAGTDALHQLPFFITTCDYTLIGEELYAASAYLSREPMLLGSLKGQDIGKAMVMLLIILQTLFFIISANWNWLRMLVEPL